LGAALALVAAAGWLVSDCSAQRPGVPDKSEPVYREAKVTPVTEARPVAAEHPMMIAIRIAQEGLASMERDVKDYTATLIKRERVGDQVMDYEFMTIKVRNERVEGGQVTTPFSVYLKYMKPKNIAGREVIYVKGQNNGKLCAKEAGGLLPAVWLPPDGFLAMRNQRYPITEIGIHNLVVKLIERATDDMKHGPAEVQVLDNFKINKRDCKVISVTHPEKKPGFTFYHAKVFIDKELNVPVRYEAYDWPEVPGSKLSAAELIEEYTYVDIKVNQGLTNGDFDTKNPNYNF
jgi:hypothetical protein